MKFGEGAGGGGGRREEEEDNCELYVNMRGIHFLDSLGLKWFLEYSVSCEIGH